MKQLIFTLLMMGACLSATAATPRFVNGNLTKITDISKVESLRKDNKLPMTRLEPLDNMANPRAFFKNHNVTPGSNPVSKRAPRRLSDNDVLSTYYLDFRYVYTPNEDFTDLEPDDYFFRSNLGTYWMLEEDQLYCAGLYYDENTYESWYLPVNIDYASGEVWLPTGYMIEEDTTEGTFNLSSRTKVDTIRCTFLLDSDWYMGISDDFSDVGGSIYPDGSIVFNDTLGYVYAGYQVINTYKRSGSAWTNYNYILQSSDTTYFEDFYFNTQLLVPNAMQEYDQLDANGEMNHLGHYIYMYQADQTAAVFNLCELGMSNVEINLNPDLTVTFPVNQVIGEFSPTERDAYQEYYGNMYVWDEARWYSPVSIIWDEAEQAYIEDYDEDITGSFDANAIYLNPMEYYLSRIYVPNENKYYAMFSYPILNTVLRFTDGSEFVIEEPDHYMRGDANNDGMVNLQDVFTLIDHILYDDFDDSEDFSSDNSDTNLDGTISISDVMILIDYLVNDRW